jgi:hypothetical protein
MSVPVNVSGAWSANGGLDFALAAVGNTYFSNALVAFGGNPATYINKVKSLVVTGPDAAFFNGNPEAFTLPFNAGGARTIELVISFSPNAVRVFNASLQITYQPTTISGDQVLIIPLKGTGVAGGTAEAGFNIPVLQFPGVEFSLTENYPGTALSVENFSNGPITITALALVGGVDFTLMTPPGLPLTLPINNSSPPFTVQFNPTGVGGLSDTLIATLSSGAQAFLQLSGQGLQITPVFNLTGTQAKTLFGFVGVVDALSPENYDTEESAMLIRKSDWGIANIEKRALRVRGHYCDFGPAVITVAVTARRLDPTDNSKTLNTTVSKDVAIGTTGSTDGWLRDFEADVIVEGEIIQINVSRAAGSGPAWIADYSPCGEVTGEVIEGT